MVNPIGKKVRQLYDLTKSYVDKKNGNKSNKYLNFVSELFPFTINISNFGCDFAKLQLQICFGFKCLKVLLK